MKNVYKKVCVVVLLFTTLTIVKSQTNVIIPPANNAGTAAIATIHRKPLGSNRAYERSAVKYTHQEIGMFGNITAIGFYCDTVLNPGITPVKIYMKEVTDSSFIASTVAAEETGATLVFNDTLHPAAFVRDSFATIVLSTPFLHATTNNIEIVIETNAGGITGTANGTDATTLSKGFRYFAVGTSRFQYWQNTAGSTTPPIVNGTLAAGNVRPNVRLTIATAASCVSPPTAGIAVTASPTVCAGTTALFTLNGNSTGIGMTYQWITSPDSVSWSTVNGATNVALTDTINAAGYFACVLTCSGLSDTSAGVHVTLNSFYQCYCHLTLGGGCGTSAIDSVGIAGTTLANGATGCSAGNYHAYPSSGNTTATLTQGQVYTLTTKFTGNVRASVWIDYNQNGTFEPSEWKQICLTSTAAANVSIPLLIPFTALPGQTGMRIRSRNAVGGGLTIDSTSACTALTSGETEDYVITINAAVPCTSPPTAGSAVSSQTAVCPGTIVSLSLNGNSSGSGLTYQWLSSTDGINWSTISGATSEVYSDTITNAISYECILTCSGLFDTSAAAAITINSFYDCYCHLTLGGGCAGANISAIDSVGIAGTTMTNGATGCSTGNYQAYPSSGNTTANLMQGQTYAFTTRFTGNVRSGVWIDYNQDGTFAPNEYNQICTTSVANTDVGISLTIPMNALTGLTGMRVRSRASAGALDSTSACATFGSGETEDYLITIDLATGIKVTSIESELTIFPNPSRGVVTVALNFSYASKLIVQVMNIEGETLYSEQSAIVNGSAKKSIDLTGFAKGIYFIRAITDKETIIKKISSQ